MAKAPHGHNVTANNVSCIVGFYTALQQPNLQALMSFFDTTQNLAVYPQVGITSYGPQFIGYNAVQRLFRQLYSSFQRIVLLPQGIIDPTGAAWLYNSNSSQIGIQMSLSGLQVGSWFAAGTPYYSPPLSGILPDSTRSMDLDASVIFTMNNNNSLIVQIAMYFDRYLMSQQLATAAKG